ncbi:hypothetical protein E3U43_008085, partial [Larimichthys crocea]
LSSLTTGRRSEDIKLEASSLPLRVFPHLWCQDVRLSGAMSSCWGDIFENHLTWNT